jgi:hypothetical protein
MQSSVLLRTRRLNTFAIWRSAVTSGTCPADGPPLYAAHSLSLHDGVKAATASLRDDCAMLRDAYGSLDPAAPLPTIGSYEGQAEMWAEYCASRPLRVPLAPMA